MINGAFSLIVPAYNEQGNIVPLVKRIAAALSKAKIIYELIMVDDHSTDKTQSEILGLAGKYPIKLVIKQGKQGKAATLLEGFACARYPIVGMIDADLQYPPEALPEMIDQLVNNQADIVVANRRTRKVSWARKFFSKGFRWMFGKFLHGLDCDVQSGLKVFRKEIIEQINLQPTPWTFDLEFLLKARELGYVIGEVNIEFGKRSSGETKVKLLKTSWEIGWSALKLKFAKQEKMMFSDWERRQKGQGFYYRGQEFIYHTDLAEEETAFQQLTARQMLWLGGLLGLAGLSLILNWRATVISAITLITLYYLADMAFNLFLIYKSLSKQVEIEVTEEEIEELGDNDWPKYTILCPLYKEWQVVPQFVQGIQQLEYPKDKLQVLLLLEEDDKQTIRKVGEFDLPEYFEVVVVPHSLPKTKPKACNYGLNKARGEYVVIYDAEDWPDSQQLKKAVLAFKKAGERTICIQAKLNYYNPVQNVLTRLFTAEYSLWFDLILPGLQSINAPIPLGGTSNHFRTKNLIDLNRWDAFNVTEDCDLGLRLVKRGFLTAIVDSTTWEEANSQIFNWYRQRTRWVKGYIQTYFVHMRDLKAFTQNGRKLQNLFFQLTVGGKVLSMIVNPFLWLLTISYFVFRPIVGETIESFYLTPILYLGVFSLVVGNFSYLYSYMIGCAKREQWHLIKYVFLVPIYWLGMSVAAWRAAYEVVTNPHYWAKTKHGLHLGQVEEEEKVEEEPLWEPGILPQPAPVYVPVGVTNGSRRGSWSLGNIWPLSLFNGNRNEKEDEKKLKVEIERGMEIKEESDNTGEKAINKSIVDSWMNQFKSATSMGGPLIIASIIGNFLNFVYNAYLGREISVEQFGVVSLIGSMVYLSQIPLQAVSRTVIYKSGYWVGKYGEYARRFWVHTRWQAAKLSIAVAGMWLMTVPMWSRIFQSDDMLPFYLFTPVWIVGTLFAIDSGFLRGSMRFTSVGLVVLVEALTKLGLSVLLVKASLNAWVYAAIPLSMTAGLLVGWRAAVRLPVDSVSLSKKVIEKIPTKFVGTSLLTRLSTLAFLNLDIVMAKYFLPPMEAGQYALLSLVGKMVFFGGSLFSQFLVPVVSKYEGAGQSSKQVFYKLLGLSAAVNLAGFVAVGWLGNFTVPILLGDKSKAILPILPVYTGASVLFAIASNIVSYYQVKKKNVFPAVGLGLSLVQIAGLIVWHQSVEVMAQVMMVSGAIYLQVMLGMHLLEDKLDQLVSEFSGRVRIIWENGNGGMLKTDNGGQKTAVDHRIQNNDGLLSRLLTALNLSSVIGFLSSIRLQINGNGKGKEFINKDKLRILIFNWRDTKHVWAGGAEAYVHEIAKRWVKDGHQVTVFCGNDKKNLGEEDVDGVHVVRKGGFYTVYFWAMAYYLFRFRGKYDVVIDCENGIPFFTPLYVRKPKFLVVYHVHQDVYLKHLKLRWWKKPLALLAKLLEGVLMPIFYENERIITISESSKQDIVQLGSFSKEQIDLVYCGVNLKQFYKGNKTDYPSFAYIGRHQYYKNVDVAIRAFKQVWEQVPNARLEIAGEGEATGDLKDLVNELGLNSAVKFHGWISDKQRSKLMSECWVMLQPSSAEGWSLVVLESNASGTPVIASNVHGLCDSVRHGETGILVPLKDVNAWAEGMLLMIIDDKLRFELGKNSYQFVQQFTWDNSADYFIQLIKDRVREAAVSELAVSYNLASEINYQE